MLSDSGSVTIVLKDLTDRTLNAVATKTWFNTDPSEPDTVELAMRMFAKHVQKVAAQRHESGGRDFTATEKDFPRVVSNRIFEKDSYDDLTHLVPHCRVWTTASPKTPLPLISTMQTMMECDLTAGDSKLRV